MERLLFDRFEVDVDNRRLLCDGQPLALEPKPFDLLMHLIGRAGELVSKQELFDHVWSGRAVTDSVLTRSVNKLRVALGDGDGQLLQTVHGYGYCLHCTVRRPPAGGPQLAPGFSPPQRPLWQLQQALPGRGNVWLARHSKTGDARVFKFALDDAEQARLKREITLYRVLQQTRSHDDSPSLVMDWNLSEAPWFLELRWCPLGSLQDWFAVHGAGCDRATRLQLALQAIDCVAAAHAVGVLHTDIKPANFLVEQSPQVNAPTGACNPGNLQLRLGDLGSGGVDSQRLDTLQLTRMGLTDAGSSGDHPGTSAYLAPERLAGEPPTLQSDVYALGVMLYQLLVGDLNRPLAPGWQRDIDDPLLVEDIAAAADLLPCHRIGSAAELGRRLRELDARRQQRDAAATLQREMHSLQQRRRAWRLLAAGVAGLLLISGLYSWQLLKARDAAETAAALNRELHTFIVNDLLGAADPFRAGGGEQVTVKSVLDKARERSRQQLADRPQLYAGVMLALGTSYRHLSQPKLALESFRAGLDAITDQGDTEPGLRRDLQLGEIETLIDQSRYPEAKAKLAALPLPAAADHDAPRYWRQLNAQSWLEKNLGAYAKALQTVQPVLQGTETLVNKNADRSLQELRATALWHYAEASHQQGRWQQAEQAVRESLRIYRQTRGEDSAYVAWLNVSLVWIEIAQHQFADAEQAVGEMLRNTARLPDTHLVREYAVHYRGVLRAVQGRHEEAISLLQPLLDSRLQRGERDTHLTRFVERYLAWSRWQTGELAVANTLATDSHQHCIRMLDPAHPQCVAVLAVLAHIRIAAGESEQARTLIGEHLSAAEANLPADNIYLANLRAAHALALRDHDPQHARTEQQRALDVYRRSFGDTHPDTRALAALNITSTRQPAHMAQRAEAR